MTAVQYLQPTSLDEALDLLARHDDVATIAGGTTVMPLVNEGRIRPATVMGLRRAGLDGVERDGDRVRLGATVTMSELAGITELQPAAAAAAAMGGWAIRNMATVGGNLLATAPYGDVGVALLALDAEAELAGPGGRRSVPLAEFHGDGSNGAGVQPGELLAGLSVPVPDGISDYHKMGRRELNSPAIVTTAVRVVTDGGSVIEARIALGAAAPRPIRATRAEQALIGSRLDAEAIGRAAEAAAADAAPATDGIATAWYRRRMIAVQVGRALERIAAQGG